MDGSANWKIVLVAVFLAGSALLLPWHTATAQAAPNACKNDAGQAVAPRAGAGVGAWLLVLNFNHAPSATTTTGCLVTTTALNPQQVSRTLVACQLTGNVNGVQVGNGTAPFDGNLVVSCPGLGAGKQTLQNFTIWGRANFAAASKSYSIVQHPDAALTVNVSAGWNVLFNSRYGASTFSSGDPVTNINGQVVTFMSAVEALQGSHRLNNTPLPPPTTVSPFEYRYGQPLTVGAAGQTWTLAELIIDPPGGCCRSQS